MESTLLDENKNLLNEKNIKNSRNKYNLEENKNHYWKYRKNINIITKKNNKEVTPRNKKFLPILLKSNRNNYFNNNNTIYQNKNKFDNTILINRNKYKYNDDNIFKTLNKSPSACYILNKKIKKISLYNGLNRNNSTSELLNKNTIFYFPAIKPRKIIIDYCTGPYELHVTDINKKNFSYKKYGYSSSFMGDKYNPQNYEINQRNLLNRNYYGKLFSN